MNGFIFLTMVHTLMGYVCGYYRSNKRKGHFNPGCNVGQACGSDERINKMEQFRERTGTQKSISVVPVSTDGVKTNEFSDIVQRIITGDDLFC